MSQSQVKPGLVRAIRNAGARLSKRLQPLPRRINLAYRLVSCAETGGINIEGHSQNEIMMAWYVDDVLSLRPELTEKQAQVVLQRVQKLHVTTGRMNWDVLESVADQILEEFNGS